MLQRLRQRILNNLGIKLTALILALAVYAHVYSQQEQVAILQLPVSVEGLPRSLTFRGEVPDQIGVRIRAKGAELLKLRTQSPRAVVRLEQPRAGLMQRPITTNDVELPPESKAIVEAVVDPVILSLTIEPMEATVVPVAVRTRGAPIAGTMRFGPIRVWPDTVTIAGPASLIARIDSLETEEVDLAGRSETVGETVRLAIPQEIRTRVEWVSVRIPIVAVARRAVGPLRVSLPLELRSGWQVSPESVLVHLAGPETLLETITSTDLRPRVIPSIPAAPDETLLVHAGLSSAVSVFVQVETVEPSAVLLVRRSR